MRQLLLTRHVSFLLLCNKLSQILWLKVTHIYYLTVSIDQKFKHSVAGFSAQGATHRVGQGWVLSGPGVLAKLTGCWWEAFP